MGYKGPMGQEAFTNTYKEAALLTAEFYSKREFNDWTLKSAISGAGKPSAPRIDVEELVKTYGAVLGIKEKYITRFLRNQAAMSAVESFLMLAAPLMAITIIEVYFSGCVGPHDAPTGSYKDSATQGVDQAKAKCTDYLAGKGARDVQMDSLCSDVKTIDKQDKQLGAAPTPAVAAGEDVPYDSDGKGIDMKIDGIDWSNPNVWFGPDVLKEGGVEALGVIRDGKDIYLLYVARNDLDASKTSLMITGYQDDPRNPEIGGYLLQSGFKLLAGDNTVQDALKAKYDNAPTTSKGKIKQVKLEGYAEILEKYISGKTTRIDLSVPGKTIEFISIAKELGFNQ